MYKSLFLYRSLIVTCARYKYDWKIEEAQKNILRTHTTAVSARMLYKLAQQVSTYASWLSQLTQLESDFYISHKIKVRVETQEVCVTNCGFIFYNSTALIVVP